MVNACMGCFRVTSALGGFDSVVTTRLFKDHALRSGLLGSIKVVPAGHRFEVVVHVGSRGINRVLLNLGLISVVSAICSRRTHAAPCSSQCLGKKKGKKKVAP